MQQIQIQRLPKMGDFQMPPGDIYGQAQLKVSPLMNMPPNVYGQAQLKPETVMNMPPDVYGYAQPLPEAAAPGAVLPTQAPTYLFPTTTPQEAPAPESKGPSTTTLLVGGLVVIGTIAALALLLKD